MDKKRHAILPVFSSQLTSTISVAIVLFILGVVAMLGIAAHTASRSISEHTGFVAVLSPSATDSQIQQLKAYWLKAPFVADMRYASPDEVMTRWQQMMGTDADGMPGLDELGGNPFFGEFEINLRAAYTHPDSIDAIISTASRLEGIGEVKHYGEAASAVNRSIRSIMLVLAVIAAALALISFVLINNTVRLAIFSQRFIIHTMKLVGATAGFIRRPFVTMHLLAGAVAGVTATAALAALLHYLTVVEPEVADLAPWSDAAWVLGCMPVAGAALAALAALAGANRYIRLSYDDLFD